jgi:fructose-1,6-bisphosphatase II / sedoheptulose-1,7-bisphosphatase
VKHLSFDILHCAEQAALASYYWIGRGDEKAADAAAVAAMRTALNATLIQGRIVIGEGERDKAPMLYIGEEVGTGEGLEIDVALDPLEGTTLCAQAQGDALNVVAFAKKGHLLHAPDVYMQKIAVGANIPATAINLDASTTDNILNVARAKGCAVHDLHLMILNRERHQPIIEEARALGCHVALIQDGDVSAIIQAALPTSPVDIVMGTGGAPEGVLAAAALRCLGGHMFARLLFDNESQVQRAASMGISDPNAIYSEQDMARGDVLFCASGVTDGALVKGVKHLPHFITTESLLLCSETGMARVIISQHQG